MLDDGDEEEWTKVYFHHNTSASFSDMPISFNVTQQSWLPRRPSVSSPTGPNHPQWLLQPKGPSSDGVALEFGSRHGHNVDNIASESAESSASPSAHDSSLHSVPVHSHFQQHSSSLPSRNRMSLLSAASDALSFRKKIGSVSRRKQNFHSMSHTNNVVPEFIEINACNNTTITSTVGGTTAHRDSEHEERERLRDAAAHSIGLDPELLHKFSKSESRSSLDFSQTPPQSYIPPFPATLTALRPFTELSSTLLKFNPPSSLLVYALAKQWKQRLIVLTSHSPSQKTYVHLFKSSSKDDREIERIQVTENSVIFVAEEEVGGRGNVVKFAGKNVSTKRNGANAEESLHTMWFLQIADPAESQRWIAAIKNAVLIQRAVRAGLGIPTQTTGGNEPKGDIDVMLSMHLQGLISTNSTKSSSAVSFPSPTMPASPSPPPSLHSLKINIPSSSSPSTSIKGIFSAARPRSPSVEGSPASAHSHGHTEDSFGVVGTSLLTMLRTKSSAESNSSLPHALPIPLPHVSGEGSPAPSLRSANAPIIITASDLKISKERDAPEVSDAILEASSSSTPPGSNTPPTPSLSPLGTLTLSLQPPPRKSKHIVTVPAIFLPDQERMYKQASGICSVAGNFGISSGSTGDVTPRDTSPVSPGSSSVSGGWSGSFSPNSGIELQSPYIGEASGYEESDEVLPTLLENENMTSLQSLQGRIMPPDRLSQSIAITKRWSRQGVPLPKQLTPPSGPPPSIPLSSEPASRTSMESSVSVPATYATDPSLGSSSPNSYCQAQFGSRSRSSLSPTFWKRVSGSSMHSISSTNTSESQDRSHVSVSLSKDSFYSSLGSTSRGTSSRPTSLLVPVSSSVGHTGATKRRSMPPPRPAPKFAPPPAPAIQESISERTHSMFASHKSFGSSIAKRALRLSLTSPKPPPSSALPPPPDESIIASFHRRSSSSGTTDLHPVSAPSSRPASALSRNSNSIGSVSSPARNLSIRQRLRILSTPPTSSSPLHSPSFLTPSLQVSTLDLSDDNDDDDLPTPSFHSPQPVGLGGQIMTIQNYPSFLQLSTPDTPTAQKPQSRSTFRSDPPLLSTAGGLRTLPFEPDCDFVALSPPPRRGSKPHIVAARRAGKLDTDRSGVPGEESKLVNVSQRGSVVSLGFVTS